MTTVEWSVAGPTAASSLTVELDSPEEPESGSQGWAVVGLIRTLLTCICASTCSDRPEGIASAVP